jgi:hypothetical protein
VPPVLAEAMQYSVTAGGKRLRPMLVLAAAEATAEARGGSVEAAIELAMPAGPPAPPPSRRRRAAASTPPASRRHTAPAG